MERLRGRFQKLLARLPHLNIDRVKRSPELSRDVESLRLWDLTDPEKAKAADLEPDYYVDVPGVSAKQYEDYNVLDNYVVPINLFLAKALPQRDKEKLIPFPGIRNGVMDLNNFWQISVTAYNPQMGHMLVRAHRVNLNPTPKSNP